MQSLYVQLNCINISEAVKPNQIYAMLISYKKEQQGVQGTDIPNLKSPRCYHCLFSHSSRIDQ